MLGEPTPAQGAPTRPPMPAATRSKSLMFVFTFFRFGLGLRRRLDQPSK